MLNVFHRSFNLPGLRYGLFTPVAKEDYYPPEEHQTTTGQPQAVQAGLRAQARTSNLLRQASELLGGEAAEAIEEEIASIPDAHLEQSELARWMAQSDTEPRHSPLRRGNSSAAPIRTESRPRTGGSAAPHRSASCRGGALRGDYPS